MGMAPQDEESKEAVQMFGSLTGSGGNNIGKAPRDENYWDMWKSTFCPQFSYASFTFMIFALNTLVYLMSLLMTIGPDRRLNDLVFLGPDLLTLEKWGALDSYKIHEDY